MSPTNLQTAPPNHSPAATRSYVMNAPMSTHSAAQEQDDSDPFDDEDAQVPTIDDVFDSADQDISENTGHQTHHTDASIIVPGISDEFIASAPGSAPPPVHDPSQRQQYEITAAVFIREILRFAGRKPLDSDELKSLAESWWQNFGYTIQLRYLQETGPGSLLEMMKERGFTTGAQLLALWHETKGRELAIENSALQRQQQEAEQRANSEQAPERTIGQGMQFFQIVAMQCGMREDEL